MSTKNKNNNKKKNYNKQLQFATFSAIALRYQQMLTEIVFKKQQQKIVFRAEIIGDSKMNTHQLPTNDCQLTNALERI